MRLAQLEGSKEPHMVIDEKATPAYRVSYNVLLTIPHTLIDIEYRE